MSENVITLLKEARERCGMAWSDGDDPDDIAGRIDKFLEEADERIQFTVFQQGPANLQVVMYHEKGISIFDVRMVQAESHAQHLSQLSLTAHDDASRESFFDLVNDYLRTPR